MNTIKLNNDKVKMIAHRGLSGLEKENTCSAFVAAGNREKYFGIETDVHVTADHKFIIIHDDDTQRVGIDHLSVEGSTYETLRKLRLCDIDGKRGRADLILPALTDYINICKKYEKKSILELKNPMQPEEVREIIDVVRENGYLEETVIISFCLDNLIVAREYLPEQHIMYLKEDDCPDAVFEALDKYNFDLDIDRKIITQEIIDRCHAAGHAVNVWTVNTYEEGIKLIEMGVDYITTNILE